MDEDFSRSVALLLHDGLRFTPRPLTDKQVTDLIWGLRMIALGLALDDSERDLHQSMLDHGWQTIAPFVPPTDTRSRI